MPDPADPSSAPPPDDASRRTALDWALRPLDDPAMTAADWLAADIVPGSTGALALLGDPTTPLGSLRAAKEAFKTMRVAGELPADRRLGARLYLGAIAAALAYHGERISAQGEETLRNALAEMRDDQEADAALRRLAGAALRRLPAQPGSRG